MANYYTQYTPVTVNSNEIWGNNDVDGNGAVDGGDTPLKMTLHPNDGYYVNSSMFNIKGLEPSSIGPDGQRRWENGETTTDASGNSVTIDLGNFSKIEMFDEVSYDIVFPDFSNAWGDGLTLFPGDYTNYLFDVFGGNIPIGSWYAIVFSRPPDGIGGENYYIDPILFPNGEEIQDGDLIGVFSENNGQYTCCGLMQWDSASTSQYLTVLGQNSDGIGMQLGETMHIFIKDVSTDTIYSATPTQQPDVMFGDFVFIAFPQFSEGFIDGGETPWCFESLETSADIVTPTAINDGNYVNVHAWLNPDYTIGFTNVELTLDIDGDATSTTPTQTEDEFYFTVKLNSGLDSNCEISTDLSYLPGGSTTQASGMHPTFGYWSPEVIDNGDETDCKIKFTKNPFYINSDVRIGASATDMYDLMFVISPKDGYTVSRSNFWVETVGDWTSNQNQFNMSGWELPASGPNCYIDPQHDQTGNVRIHSLLTEIDGDYTTPNNNITTYLAQQWGAISTTYPLGGRRIADLVTNPKVGLENVLNGNITYFNIQNIDEAGGFFSWGPGDKPAITLYDAMWYPDDCESDTQDILGGVCSWPESVNFQMLSNCEDYNVCDTICPWTYENNPLKNDLNPSGYINNVVILRFKMLWNYDPQSNVDDNGIPNNMIFTINGEAMENPSNTSIDTNFNINLTEFVPTMGV